jgi:hypothetical protein
VAAGEKIELAVDGEKLKQETTLKIEMYRWEVNIKLCLKETELEIIDWIRVVSEQ